MREYVLVTTADVPADRLWAVAADVRDWPAWADTASGRGNWSRLTVEEAVPPARVTAVASRFLAHARFEYSFESCGPGTRVRVAVALHGPLGFAYRRSFDRHMQRTFSALVARLIERAWEAAGPGGPPSPAAGRTGRTERTPPPLCEVHT